MKVIVKTVFFLMISLVIILAIIVAVAFAFTFVESKLGVFDDVHIPKRYVRSEEHWDKEGFQDFVDFCIYQYDSGSAIEADSSYEILAETDIENVAGYFSDFEGWMSAAHRLDEYSFDESCISAGDYCYIKTKEGQPVGGTAYGKYDNYTVYFFDVETFTLYYIHANI